MNPKSDRRASKNPLGCNGQFLVPKKRNPLTDPAPFFDHFPFKSQAKINGKIDVPKTVKIIKQLLKNDATINAEVHDFSIFSRRMVFSRNTRL